MSKILLILIMVFSTVVYAKSVIVVSILPQKTFVEKITKDKFDVVVMVQPGSSPHSYEPKPSQMLAVSNASLYLSIGVEFEEVWLERFKAHNSSLKIVDIASNISKIEMGKGHHHEHEEHHDEHLDPHIWTSPKNVSKMAANIYEAIVTLDPQNKSFYKENLDKFMQEIDATDTQIENILKKAPTNMFMVFHPSWGYFAKDYDLEQLTVEVNGKSPKPKEIIKIIKEAKENKIKVIFTQPEFSDKSARVIAKEADVKMYKVSPLNPDWSKNLINMANAIAN